MDESLHRPPNLATLTAIMEAHSNTIPFENIDVVLSKRISLETSDIYKKLLYSNRGGYCFEQNTLLQEALIAVGFKVVPLLCRVRWGKKANEVTSYSHMALHVRQENEGVDHLVDVGFAGTNSIRPIAMEFDTPQELSDGIWRISKGNNGMIHLQVEDRIQKKMWHSLYCWSSFGSEYPDLVCANWYSCTFPSARFTNQFFACITQGTKRSHILNSEFVVRAIGGKVEEKVAIQNVEQLVHLLKAHFNLDFDAQHTSGLGRYLAS